MDFPSLVIVSIAEQLAAAVKEELTWFESFAGCRDWRRELYKSESVRRTGKMLAAAFVHETSRAKDPSLHRHVLIANVTIDPERNEALAMSCGDMFENRGDLISEPAKDSAQISQLIRVA